MEHKTTIILKVAAVIVVHIIFFATLAFCFTATIHNCSKVANEIQERGLKNIVGEVWEGRQQKGE